MATAISWCLFDRQGTDLDRLQQDLRRPEKQRDDSRILCKNCRQPVTHRSLAIESMGAHIHEYTNPHGYRYRFACYLEAPGCTETGAPSFEHSWFAGCSWQISVCRYCGEHLGWLFAGSDSFYGLITGRLEEESRPR